MANGNETNLQEWSGEGTSDGMDHPGKEDNVGTEKDAEYEDDTAFWGTQTARMNAQMEGVTLEDLSRGFTGDVEDEKSLC
jgi:hypothetical protein